MSKSWTVRPRVFKVHHHQSLKFHHHSSHIYIEDYIRLENLLQNFSKPCLVDIKLGYRTYDEDATTLKISQEIAKYFYQKTIGFRLSGMKIYDPSDDAYKVY